MENKRGGGGGGKKRGVLMKGETGKKGRGKREKEIRNWGGGGGGRVSFQVLGSGSTVCDP